MDIDVLKLVARRMVGKQRRNLALTGAGISVESGIPDFRSPGGLWERYNPIEYASIEVFRKNPHKVWNMIRDLAEMLIGAKPNPAHRGLARLEDLGVLQAVITQNIDDLHQQAGSKNVIELHGNGQRLHCQQCGAYRDALEAKAHWDTEFPPLCPACKTIMKPDVIFFGEPLPVDDLREAMRLTQLSDVVLMIGTSLMVAPASYLPIVAKKTGAMLVEINTDQTIVSEGFADYQLVGPAGEIVPALVSEIEVLLTHLRARW
jgi:NAD-dependent deacetylase